jgi:hypothetical protein
MLNKIVAKSANNEAIDPYKSQEIAQSLRKYLVSGSKQEEESLVNQLNSNFNILQRFFPTKGQTSVMKMNTERLAAIRKNETEIMNLHHDLYVEALQVQKYQIIEIEKARAGSIVTAEKLQFLETLNKIAVEKVESIIATTGESRKKMNMKFLGDMREHKANFSDPDAVEFLELSMTQTRQEMAAHMEVTEQMLSDTVSAIKSKSTEMALHLKQ